MLYTNLTKPKVHVAIANYLLKMTLEDPYTSATHVELSPSTTPGYTHIDGLTTECAKKASDLLTVNHGLYHTRWSELGFHSKITPTKTYPHHTFAHAL